MIDAAASRYTEIKTVGTDFAEEELEHLRFLLRRLRFLETKIMEKGGRSQCFHGAALYMVKEMDALEWVLIDAGFINPVD